MICPYAVNRLVGVNTIFEYNEEGMQTQQKTVEKNEASFLECQGEDCGAWQDGHCCYNKRND